jgi:hypothetical protein
MYDDIKGMFKDYDEYNFDNVVFMASSASSEYSCLTIIGTSLKLG